jgi:type IV pilus assembly protein PilE
MSMTNLIPNVSPESSTSKGGATTMQQTFIRKGRYPTARPKGFSLIEMMIVVVVIAILAAIAIPIYQRQIQESRRTAAKTGLLDVASREEKYYSTNNQYIADLATLGYTGTGGSITVPNNTPATDYYTIKVTLTGAITPGSNFTATAVPIATSTQASDVCGTYSITDLGVQGNQNGTQTTGCW